MAAEKRKGEDNTRIEETAQFLVAIEIFETHSTAVL